MADFNVKVFKDFVNDNNNPYLAKNMQNKETLNVPKMSAQIPDIDNFTKIEDQFKKIKKNRGLFEKFYDFCKNSTGFGSGYKKTEQNFELVKNKKISLEELESSVDKYKKSTENSRQLLGDTTSSLTSIGTLFGVTNALEKLKTQFAVGATNARVVQTINHLTNNDAKETAKNLPGILKVIGKTTAKAANGLKKVAVSGKFGKIMFALPIAMLVGGYTKYITLKINRISSHEFDIKSKKELGKQEYKKQKKAMNKAKCVQSFKNFWTGMVNGLLSPITMVGGALVGTPLYIAATTGTRYITSDNDYKSLSDFGNEIKDNGIINTLMALAVAIPAFKTARYSQVLSKNLKTVTEQLKGAKLVSAEVQRSRTALSEMQGLIYKSDGVKRILSDNSLSIDEKITKLTEENIFAVKFLQTDANRSEITKALKENCPSTRTLFEAGEDINRLLGTTDYKVTKCLGTGTIAETYLATDKTGKEVAVKILKKGISAEKIMADKEKFLSLITKGLPEAQLSEHQKYLKRNLDDLASNILKEVDLENEAKAAKELAKITKKANVVKPIFTKNGVYVMEKADGISFECLHDYAMAKTELEGLKRSRYSGMYKAEIQKCEEKIAAIKAKSPAFADFDITHEQLKKILKEYMDVQTEQFVKVNKNGKIIHGDIHPGNIFVDLDVLKGAKKGKLFTLIDTGNVINMTKEQVKDSLRMTAFIKNGNYKDIARIVTETSILPDGLTREHARAFVEAELKKYFTDTTHSLEKMNLDNLYKLTDAIQAQKGIIPNNTQLTLEKSKKSARDSFMKLFESFGRMKYGNIDEDSKMEIAKAMATLAKDMTSIGTKMATSNAIQETKNLLQMSPKEALAFLKNKNMLPLNSTEHLIYKLKQQIPGADIGDVLSQVESYSVL